MTLHDHPHDYPFCQEHDEAITALLMNELEGEARTRMAEHLLQCGACRDEHAQRARTVASLRELPEVPASLTAERRAALRAAAGRSEAPAVAEPRGAVSILTSIAAVVILGLLVTTLVVPSVRLSHEKPKFETAGNGSNKDKSQVRFITTDEASVLETGLKSDLPRAAGERAVSSSLPIAKLGDDKSDSGKVSYTWVRRIEPGANIYASPEELALALEADPTMSNQEVPTGLTLLTPSETGFGYVPYTESFDIDSGIREDATDTDEMTVGILQDALPKTRTVVVKPEDATNNPNPGSGGAGGQARPDGLRILGGDEALPSTKDKRAPVRRYSNAPSTSAPQPDPSSDYDLEEIIASPVREEKDADASFIGGGAGGFEVEPGRRGAGSATGRAGRLAETPETRVLRLYQSLQRRPGETPSMMFHRYWGDNPFVDARRDALATFALDIDTASYTLARNYLSRGVIPPKGAIRSEEFVNYFPSNYAPPTRGDFRIQADLAPSVFAHQEDVFLLKVGIKAREIEESARKPLALTFVIDVSGSMAQENRLELVKESIRVLVSELDERDSLGIVVFESTARDVLEPVMLTESNKDKISECLLSLSPGSSTNAQQGLDLGYAMAIRQLRKDGVNRVVMFSDGVANTGVTTAQGMLARVAECRAQDVFLSTFGVGMGNHNDELLEQLANKGDGQCAYIDSRREAVRIFRRNLVGTFQPVAREAKVQVEFDPQVVAAHRQIGYENRTLAHKDFRNDAIDAGEVNAGHEIVALFELELRPEQRAELLAGRVSPATVRLRYKQIDAPEVVELEEKAVGTGIDHFENAAPRFRLSAVVAAFADLLRNSYWSRNTQLAEVREVAQSLLVLDTPEDGRVAELLALMQQADGLLAQREGPTVTQRAYDQLRYNYYLRQRLADMARAEAEQYHKRLEDENQRLEQELRRLLVNPQGERQ